MLAQKVSRRVRRALQPVLRPQQWQRKRRIDGVCRGYSRWAHWDFFDTVLGLPGVRNVCVLGVYFGRDLAYMAAAMERLGKPAYHIDGIDLFADVPGSDWPDEKRGLSWEEAGVGPAPSLAAASSNLDRLGVDDRVTVHQGDAIEFLERAERTYDFVYIDIAHDYEITRDAIEAARPRIRPGGWLGGDDYSDQGSWGVKKAVEESFAEHRVFDDWIWLAQAHPWVASD